MPPYSGPSKERDMYSARFIRVEEKLYVSEPDDESINHKELAAQDGILSEIQRLKNENPRAVDAGKIFVCKNEISVIGSSWTLGLPDEFIEKEARSKTITQFKATSEDYTIHDSGI